MKKLMIAACAVAFAAGVQAATVTWFNSNYTAYAGGNFPAAGAEMYLIQSSAHGQDAFFTLLASSTDLASMESTISSWAADTLPAAGNYGEFNRKDIATTAFTAGGSEYAYVVLFDAERDNVFISQNTKADYSATSQDPSYSFNFNSMGTASEQKAFTTKDNQGAGWYSVVPEPTSGLLLLLGVAGLALRRRRA